MLCILLNVPQRILKEGKNIETVSNTSYSDPSSSPRASPRRDLSTNTQPIDEEITSTTSVCLTHTVQTCRTAKDSTSHERAADAVSKVDWETDWTEARLTLHRW